MMHRAFSYLMAAGLAACAGPALAHSGHGDGFAAGFSHPISGADHVLAMVAVGLWAALRGGAALYLWPAAFVVAMLAGFGLAQFDFVIPHLEPTIAASVIALGAAVAVGLRGPLWLGAAAIACAGLAHGFAHGTEVSGAALPFAAGFALTTSLLHGVGIGAGLLAARLSRPEYLRIAGAGVAVGGLALAVLA